MTIAELDTAIDALRRELTDVRAMDKCATCECFLGVVAQAAADLKRLESPSAAGARDEFEGWLAEAEGRMRSCQHCDICVPAGPYQRFREALAATPPGGRDVAGAEGDDAGTRACGCSPEGCG